ncbi:phage holin family protein [Mycoplasmatota bacterium WC44]
MKFLLGIKVTFTVIGGYIGYIFGGFDGFIYTLLAFLIFDYITGLMVAVVEKKLSSEIGFKGIFKKIVILMLVVLSHLIDTNIIGEGSVVRNAVIFFYISNEGISIIENAVKLGLPIPGKLKDILLQLNDYKDRNGK